MIYAFESFLLLLFLSLSALLLVQKPLSLKACILEFERAFKSCEVDLRFDLNCLQNFEGRRVFRRAVFINGELRLLELGFEC